MIRSNFRSKTLQLTKVCHTTIINALSLCLVLDSKIRIQSLTQKDVKMIEDKNTVLNRRQQIREKSLNRKPHSTGLELAILPDPVKKVI